MRPARLFLWLGLSLCAALPARAQLSFPGMEVPPTAAPAAPASPAPAAPASPAPVTGNKPTPVTAPLAPGTPPPAAPSTFPAAPSTFPAAPSTFPAAPSTSPAAPPVPAETPLPGLADASFAGDAEADPATSVILDNADTFTQTTPGKWNGDGNVRVRYKGYALTSDHVEADLDAGETLFSGHVLLKAPNGETVDGGPDGTLRLNLRRDTYQVNGARTTIGPEALNQASNIGIILPVFVYGGAISSQPGLIDARGSSFTTCDFLQPHYFFRAKQTYIFPGRRLVAKNVSFYRKDRRIFTLPYLFVPLNQRFARQTLFPQVGQSPDEGYFIKFAFGYALASSLPGILRVEEMQKKGTGLGFAQNYGAPDTPRKGSGLVSLYRLYDRTRGLENINGSLDHSQTFGTVQAQLSSQLQQNSYLSGFSKSRSANSSLNLTRNVGNLSTALRTNLAQNDYGAGNTQTLTSSLDQTFRPTGRAQLGTRFDYSQYASPGFGGAGGTNTRALDTNINYGQKGRLFDLQLLGTKHSQLHGGGVQTFGGVERLPELRLGTDAARLTAFHGFVPKSTLFTLSLGELSEPTSHTSAERLRFGMDLGSNTKTLNARNFLDYGGSFQQGIYGNDTAQYVLNGRTGYRLKIGAQSSVGVTYTYLRPYGYTPFQFDYAGYSNVSSLNYSYQETRALRLTLATGYDFNRERGRNGFGATPWQNVAFQSVFAPADAFRLRTTASYDLNHNTLLDLTNAVRVRGGQGLALDVSSRFAPMQHKFSNINGNLDLPFFRDPNPAEDAGYRLRAIGGYNGFTRRFDYQGLAFTRSWHDYEASVIYQDTPNGLRPGSSLTLNFRLKAFPASEPFAIGQFGQSLDTGIGEVY